MIEYQRAVEEMLQRVPTLRRTVDMPRLQQAFTTGQEAGKKAAESPVLRELETQVRATSVEQSLRRVTVPQPQDALIGDTAAFRRGYVTGLGEFVAAHKPKDSIINLDLLPSLTVPYVLPSPDVVLTDAGLLAYLGGLRRTNPGERRVANPRPRLNYSNINLEDAKITFPGLAELQSQAKATENTRQGYKLGFAVGVIRDFGVTLQPFEVPADDTASLWFSKGQSGDPKPVPPKPHSEIDDIIVKKSFRKENINFEEKLNFRDKRSSIFNDEPQQPQAPTWIYDAVDESAYRSGLRVWLASQGVEGVWVEAIRHPAALDGFKNGLSWRNPQTRPQFGGLLSDRLGLLGYPSSLTPPKFKDREIINREPEEFRTSEKYISRYEPIRKEILNPTPQTEDQRQRESGYSLGLMARMTQKRTPRQQS